MSRSVTIRNIEEQLPLKSKWWEDASNTLIFPNSLTGILLSMVFLTIQTLDLISFSYIVAFRTYSLGRPLFYNWEIFCDLVMLVNIVLTFVTAYEKQTMSKGKNDMKWETNLKVISVSYLRFYFIIDCLGCIPTLITLNQNNCIFYFKFFRLLGLPKLFL